MELLRIFASIFIPMVLILGLLVVTILPGYWIANKVADRAGDNVGMGALVLWVMFAVTAVLSVLIYVEGGLR